MSATVLGKRLRAAAGTKRDASHTTSSHFNAKPRIPAHPANDENQNPFASHDCHSGDEVGERPTKKARSSARSVPAKHGAPESRVVLSPSTISSHYTIGKVDAGELRDEKVTCTRVLTPSTPRHRDALSKKIAVTPRHRSLITGSQLTPRTPRTPGTPSGTAVYNTARRLFSRCSHPGRLVGRECERAELSAFLESRMASCQGGCLYVSGPPGTGKSALLSEAIEEQVAGQDSVNVSVVNCMSVRNSKELSQKLSRDLGLGENTTLGGLQSCFIASKAIREKQEDNAKYLVVLDEVDRLVELDLSLLYNLFEWSMHPESRLILIGIANALDLTDRFLPRLKARNLKPELLPFMPYTAAQIVEVLTARLRSLVPGDLHTVPFIHPSALQFCAKKVAGQTGDLRKAFDICRRAIDLVEQEIREKDAAVLVEVSPSKTPLMENVNLSSPSNPRSPSKSARPVMVYSTESAPKATIAHIAKVTAQAFSNGATQRLSNLNLQQKAVLCALAALEARRREMEVQRNIFSTPSARHTTNSAPSIKQLFSAYTNLCRREQLFHPLSSVEFRDVVSGLETLSLISAVDGKAGSFAATPVTPSRTPSRRSKFGTAGKGDEKRVGSVVGVKELTAALHGPGGELLREMLDGDVALE